MSVPEKERLEGISARAFEHPADRAATAALKAIPMLDTVVRKLIEFGYERALRQSLLAGALRVGPEQLPQLWAGQVNAFARLDVDPVPDLYVTQFPIANAAAIGASKPLVVINSRAVELLDELEQRTVLGHEAGHILAQHVTYRSALLILLSLGNAAGLGLLAGLPLLGVQLALLEWSRAAELSADRAATLVNRDPLVTCRTLMVLAAGMDSSRLNLEAFVRQAKDYEDWDSGWDRIGRLRSQLTLTHDYPVRRAQEVMRWVQSGDYDRIVAGDYMRRGHEPPVREEASDAVEHYADRFRQAFKDAGETVERLGKAAGDAGQRLAEWLRG